MSPRQYWYPLAQPERTDLEAYQAPHFQRAITSNQLGGFLAERGITRIWELREYGPEYELEASTFDPQYNGAEGYWTSQTLDWILYASHESSITVGGWMLAEVKKAWSTREHYIWTTPFFE